MVARKPGAKGGGKLDPTVTLKSKPVGDPTVALKTPDKPPSTSALTDPVSTAADGSKPAEELEKQAQRQRDPKQALTSYNKLLETNPNYAYAGDVYVSMYQLAERSHADTLDKLKYAGMAAQKLEAGLSRGKVNPQQINQFKRLEEKLTNEWITNEIAKIRAGKE